MSLSGVDGNSKVVIVGCGIIGLSTAFYLSDLIPPTSITILDASPTLFDCASGKAGGFLAKGSFSSRTMLELGALSFDEHQKLSDTYNGKDKWGYRESLSYSTSGDTWTSTDDSRLVKDGTRAAASKSNDRGQFVSGPPWFKGTQCHPASRGEGATTAQIDPRRFCQFLLDTCTSRGVKVEHPVKVTGATIQDGTITHVEYQSSSDQPFLLPCTHLLISSGAWTPTVFRTLFPSSTLQIPITNLAGWLIHLQPTSNHPSHQIPSDPCHDVFLTSSFANENFSPEMLSRIIDESSQAELLIGGLNSSSLPLPDPSKPADVPSFTDPNIQSLIRVAKALLTLDESNSSSNDQLSFNGLTVTHTGLCHRPVTSSGHPIIGKVDKRLYTTESESGQNDIGGLFICAGHGTRGIALAPGTGKVMADIMMKGGSATAKWSALGLNPSHT